MPAARNEVGSWRTPTVRVPPFTAGLELGALEAVEPLPPPPLPHAASTTRAPAARAPAILCPVRVRVMDSLLPLTQPFTGGRSPHVAGPFWRGAGGGYITRQDDFVEPSAHILAGSIGQLTDMIDRIRRSSRGRGVTPRRFRSRVLLAMLTVALVPLGIFAVVVAADLGAVTRSTVDETNRSILKDQVDAHQRQVADQAQALRVQVERVAATLRTLRDLALQGLQPAPADAQPTSFVEYRGLHYVSDGASTVIAGRPLGAPAFDSAVAGRDAGSTGMLLGKMQDLARTDPGVIQDVWIADTVDTVVRTVPGIPGVRAALDRRSGTGPVLLGADGATPFSAIGIAAAEPAAWAGDPARPDASRPADASVNWTEPYDAATSDPPPAIGVTAWMAAGMGGRYHVGVDVSVGQLTSGLLDLHPAGEPHAYPLLMSSGSRLLAGGNPAGDEFGRLGEPLRLPPDPTFRAGLGAVEATGHPQALPVHVGGADKELFTAAI